MMLMDAIKTIEGDPVTLALFVLGATTLYLLGKAWRRYLETKKPFPNVPMAKGSHFILGHAGDILSTDNFQEAFKRLEVDSANEYGQTGFWVLGLPFLSVNSVQDARTILNSEHERHPPKLFQHFNRNFIGERNLLTINGREWKFHRGAVARTFNPKFLMASRAGMRVVAKTMVVSLQEKIRQAPDGVKELDVEPLMKMITLDIFGHVALSTDLGLCKTLTPSPLVKAFEYLLKTTMARMRSPFRPRNFLYRLPVKQNRVHHQERRLIRSFVADLINDKRDSMVDDDKDLLSHLVRAHRDAPGGKLKPEDVSQDAMTDVLMTLLFAGYDTTSVTLAFALYLLAQNQKAQELCVEEINAVASGENIEELMYCKAVIWEALRLYPAAVRSTRTLSKDIPLEGGFVAPAGTRVVIPIWSIHRNEKVFQHPQEFRPDRWVKQNGGKTRWIERDESDRSSSIPVGDKKAMLAFSAGGRNCVGQKFAIQEAVIVLAELLQSLKFSPKDGYKLETTIKDLILKPQHGMPLKIESRSY